VTKLAKKLAHYAGQRYDQEVTRTEYESQSFRRLNERAIEYRFVFEAIRELGPRTILDVGTGLSALPSLMRTCGPVVTAIDNVRDYWPEGMVNRHFHVRDEDATRSISGSYDLITCISVLEHIQTADAAIEVMLEALNPGGHLVLSFPYNERQYVPNVYALAGAGYGQDLPYVAQVYSRAELSRWFRNARIVKQEYWRVFSGALWTFGETLRPPVAATANELHQLTCLVVAR
jgi:2-polyprenyl-3-methyl-5-hydroxy-6-metoxy-1,4-benzoquinol methylase